MEHRLMQAADAIPPKSGKPTLRLVGKDEPAPAGRLLVSLATYNERGNIGELIAAIHGVAPKADILVIDDNSPDGTGQLVDELAAKDQRILCLHRPGKLGLGTALL